jgi:hypothetical protein
MNVGGMGRLSIGAPTTYVGTLSVKFYLSEILVFFSPNAGFGVPAWSLETGICRYFTRRK